MIKKLVSMTVILVIVLSNISFADTANSIFSSKNYAELRKETGSLMTTYNGQKYLLFEEKSVKILNLHSPQKEYVSITDSKQIELMISMVLSAKKNGDFVVPLWTPGINEFSLLYYDDVVSTPVPGYNTSKYSIAFIKKPKEYLALIDIKNNELFKYELRLGPLWRETVLEQRGIDYIKKNKYLDSTITASLKEALAVIHPKSNSKIYQYMIDKYQWKYSNFDKKNYKLEKIGTLRAQNLIDEFNFICVYLEGDK